jgi:Protein of unknown function (DUF3363)/Replication initiator protein A
MRRAPHFSNESRQLDLFVSAGSDIAARDAQDLMAWPFFSLAKTKRVRPIDFRMGEVSILVEATAEHGMATIWDADVLIWVASQIVEARDAGRATSRLIAATPHEILAFTRRGTGKASYDRLKAGLDRLQSTTIATSIRQRDARRSWEDDHGDRRHSLAVRSDLALAQQIKANGATWLDRQLLAAEPLITGNGFGADVESAKIERAQHLADQGLGRRQGTRIILARNLIATLRDRELAETAVTMAGRSGLDHAPSAEGERINGIYRERIKLASGRFALIENAHGFELVPWKPSLDRHLGAQVSGTMKTGGSIEWSIGRARGIAI